MDNHFSKDDAVEKLLIATYEDVNRAVHTEACERPPFEKYMLDFFIAGPESEKKKYLSRLPSHLHIYQYTQIEDAWVVWKARAAIARGERPEPPILYSSLTT